MNRRGFVKALVALPAAVGGLNMILKVASPDCVAHPADAAGNLYRRDYPFSWEAKHLGVLEANAVDPFDDWLDFVGEGRYASAEPVRFQVGVDLAGKDGRDVTVYFDGREIDFHREAVFGRIKICEPKLSIERPDHVEVSIEMKVDDRMSEVLEQWVEEAEAATKAAIDSVREMEERMLADSIRPDLPLADDGHQTMLRRIAKATEIPFEVLTR